ncbi:amidase domain-containing protein [Ornithinibacillus scapharcae]|uniref:amidase domain-containing protein n=1 Tax=Ornithinibacillus scapharcae TaxID=1147159 RepID=UPI000225AB6B|nr:amidase domain-containing protein [Ornithinibacillus scapharcae]
MLEVADASEAKLDDDYTLGEIESILFDYFKESTLDYEIGSIELRDYLLNQLLYDEDNNLTNHPQYKLIRAYAAEYLHELDQTQQPRIGLSENNPSVDFNLDHLKNKTIKDIKKEVNEGDSAALNSYSSEDEVGFLAAYSGSKAANYATSWYNKRNSLYNSHSNDCTNFVSQAIFAAGTSEHKPSPVPTGIKATTSHWYSDRYQEWRTNHYVYRWKESTSWIRVADFYTYWSKYIPQRNYTGNSSVISYASLGDIVLFREASTGRRYHATIVTKKANGTVYLTYHTNDTLNKNIKNISDSSNNWTVFKFTN